MIKRERLVWERILLTFVRNKNTLFYPGIKNYLIRFLMDSTLVFFVSLFYKERKTHQTFYSFLKSFVFCKEKNGALYELIDSHVAIIEQLVMYFTTKGDKIEDLIILGDVHGVETTKILVIFQDGKKKVATGGKGATDYLLCGWEKSFKIKNQEALCYAYTEGLVSRDFLMYRNNFHSWKELERFYFDFGLKVAFFLTFRITDLHYENLLISNNIPFFCDLECAFAPEINDEEYSIYLSGILDHPLGEESFGPLLGGRDMRMSLLTPVLTSYGQSPRLQWTVPSKFPKMHIPQSAGININPYLYLDAFLLGFDKSVKNIVKKRQRLLQQVQECSFRNRILFRPTRVYVALLSDFIMQISLGSDVDIEDFLYQKLKNLPLFSNVVDTSALILEEVRYLKKGLIPSFYSNIHNFAVLSGEGREITELFTTCFYEFYEHQKEIEKFFIKTRESIILAFKRSSLGKP